MSFRFWFLLSNDVKRPIGGVKQAHRLCECLVSLGFEATIIQEKESFRASWFHSNAKTISYPDFLKLRGLRKDVDIIFLAETMITSVQTFLPGFKKIIFNQNASYTFGLSSGKDGFPNDPAIVFQHYTHPDIMSIWCVSDYDYDTLTSGFQLSHMPIFRIVNAIETDLFSPSFPKVTQVCYMPRKNSLHSKRVISIAKRHSFLNKWKFISLENLSLAQVASIFSHSSVFFSFGYPEGFGLPIAEALASGCSVIGYDGLGGSELFEIGNKFGVAEKVEFADLTGFIRCLHSVDYQIFHNQSVFSSGLLSASSREATYSTSTSKEPSSLIAIS